MIPRVRSATWKTPLILAIGCSALGAFLLVLPGSHQTAAAAPVLDSEEQAFVGLINQYRQQNGLGPLTINAKLEDSSRWMSTDLGVNNYFSHTDSLRRDPFQRMADFGYNYNTWLGENIAAGAATAQQTFGLWRNSPGHDANMLGPHYVTMGLARVYTAGSSYGWYWTNDFGGYEEPSATQTPPTATPTATPSLTPTPSPASPSPTPSPPPPSRSPSPTASASLTPTASPSPTPSPSPTAKPSPATPVRTQTATPSPAPHPTASPLANKLLRGDVDCDGRVDAVDALSLLRGLANVPESGCATPLDANCDGVTDVLDALNILRFTAGLPDQQTAGCQLAT